MIFRDLRLGNQLTCVGPTVTINGVTLPTAPANLIKPNLSSTGDVFAQDDGPNGTMWLLLSGASSWQPVMDGAIGKWATACDYLGNLVWQQIGVGGQTRQILGGNILTITPWDYQSGGILDIAPSGMIRMVASPPYGWIYTRPSGGQIQITYPCQRGSRVAGFALTGGSGVVCYDISSDTLYRVWTGNPQSIPIRLDDDGQTVAISGDSGGFIPFSQWVVVPLDPVSLPPIAPFTEGKILASYDSGGAKGDNGTVEPEHFWLYRFADGKTFDYFDLENGEPVTSHPCIAYSDIASATQAIGLLHDGDALAFNVYPTAGESLETLRQRALGVIHQAVDQGLRVLLVGCAWNRLGTLSDQLVIDGMGLVRELADSFGVIGIEWFGIDRGTELGYFKPLYQQGVDRFSSPGWPAWPAEVPVAAAVTITSYGPTSGQAPLAVTANFAYDGPVMSYAARYRLLGSPNWMVDAVNPVSDSNHTYHFLSAATYEIGLAGLDGMGRVIAETGVQRLVVVSAAPSDAEEKALAQLDAALLGMKAAVDNMHAVLGK